MSRAVKNVRRSGASAERKPTDIREGNGVTKRTGLERPAPATHNPVDIADPQARVIKTDSN